MPKNLLPEQYPIFLEDAKNAIYSAIARIAREANRTNIELYWYLGKLIVERQQTYGWGSSIVDTLSKDLKREFPDTLGFSSQNLHYMRQFYNEYKDHSFLFDLAKQVRWKTNVTIFSKVKEYKQREFYLTFAAKSLCSRNVIVTQIASNAYERHHLIEKKHNFDKVLPPVLAEEAKEILKGGYRFEVAEALGITNKIIERQIEHSMVMRIKDVILELGYGFSFIGNQFKIAVENKEYFIDLLFFNRRLRSLVAVELKSGSFKAEYAGKMNLYLGLLDDFVKEKDENPSIGIIMCADRGGIELDYALRDINKPVGVSELHISKTLPNQLIGKLPNPEELRQEILLELGEQDEIDK